MIIAVGDLHGKNTWKDIIAQYPSHKLLIIGDYIDSFHIPWKIQLQNLKEIIQYKKDNPDTILLLGNHDCFSTDTEVLTEKGWRFIDDWYKDTPKLATYNIKKDIIEYLNPDKVIDKFYNGYMYEANNQGISFRITENHRILNKTTGKFSLQKIGNLNTEATSYRKFKTSLGNKKENINISDNVIRLCSWILSDGSVKVGKKGISYIIYQSKIENVTEIRNLLISLKIDFRENCRIRDIKQIAGTILKSKSKPNYEFHINQGSVLEKLIKMKYVFPKWLWNLSKYQFDIFLHTFIKADGTYPKGSITCACIYGRKDIIDQLQELCFLNGHQSSIYTYREKQYRLNINLENKESSLRFKENCFKEQSKERVFCFSTKNQTLVIRRNGKVHITGNCHYLPNWRERYSGYQKGIGYSYGVLFENNLDLFQIAFETDTHIFTHAGLSKTWMKNNNCESVNDVNELWKYQPRKFQFTGRDPYGNDKTQGPLWIRPEALLDDFWGNKIQVVGHTMKETITTLEKEGNKLIIIDNYKKEVLTL